MPTAVEDSLLLPRQAIRNGKVMLVDDEDRLTTAEVSVAYTYKDLAVLKSGIEAGSRVIIGDLSPAIEGMLLQPIIDEEAALRLAAAAVRQESGE